MRGRSRVLSGTCLGLAVACAIAACGGDDTAPVVVQPPPPTLALKAIQPVGGPRWEPGSGVTCVEVGHDPQMTIAVVAEVTNFKLRPTGTCGSSTACGHLVLRLDPSGETETVRIEAASETAEIAFDSLPLGSHTFRLELLKQSGVYVLDEDAGVPLATEVTLDVVGPGECGGVIPDGGADAGDDAADAGEDASDAGEDAADAGEDVSEAGDAADEVDAPSDAAGDVDAGD